MNKPIAIALASILAVGVAEAAEPAGGAAAPAEPARTAPAGDKDAAAPAAPATAPEAEKKAVPATKVEVVIVTNYGEITVELDAEKAPVTVANFLSYVDEKFYDGTIFHRVIRNFMIQGGGFTPALQQKRTHAPIKNEAGNGLGNARGTIAMARTGIVDSATAQFFINTVDNAFLNHRDNSPQGYGYAVFGKVTDGMEVVDAIAAVQTGRVGMMSDVPTPAPVVIATIRRK